MKGVPWKNSYCFWQVLACVQDLRTLRYCQLPGQNNLAPKAAMAGPLWSVTLAEEPPRPPGPVIASMVLRGGFQATVSCCTIPRILMVGTQILWNSSLIRGEYRATARSPLMSKVKLTACGCGWAQQMRLH